MNSEIQLDDYEYMMCVIFSERSSRSQQQIEFGNKSTKSRRIREIREDTLCGKMAEVAITKLLREEYGLRSSVNYDVYPRGDWDDEDIIINGYTVDVKATENGSHLLIEQNKIDFRKDQGKLPDLFIMCKTDINALKVKIVGCISAQKLMDPQLEIVKHIKAGEFIPGTQVKLQANNYCVRFEDLFNTEDVLNYITRRRPQ